MGNYESKSIELSAELAEGDSADDVIDKLAEIVDRKLGITPPKSEESEVDAISF